MMETSFSPPTKRLRIRSNAYTGVLPSTAELLIWQLELRSVLFNRDVYESIDALKPLLEGDGSLSFLKMDLSPPLYLDDVFDELKTFYERTVEEESEILFSLHRHQTVDVNDWKKAVELRAAVLFSTLKQLPDTNGIQVYHGVPDMETAEKLQSVVLRSEDALFWEECLRLSLLGHRVCGVGNPGIGKTTTSFHIIRELVMTHHRTVVYGVVKNRTVYYELLPVVADGVVTNIELMCHPNSTIPELIPCLKDKNAYCILDPGQTKVSCNRDNDFKAHFVMAASNDERHWGGNEFTKIRGRDVPIGTFVYCASWTEAAMLSVKSYIGLKKFSDDEVSQRYRAVGGSVSAVMAYNPQKFENNVKNALAALNPRTAEYLAYGHCNFAFNPDAPSSMLVSIAPKPGSSSLYDLSLTSDYVEEQVAASFLRNSWFAVLNEDNAGNRGNLFEAFVRHKFSRSSFDYKKCRKSLPTLPKSDKMKRNCQALENGMRIGSKRSIVRVNNMIAQVKAATSDTELFYSRSESEPLIDMICKVEYGYEATQATIQAKHDAEASKIYTLVNNLDLQQGERLTIIYAVPESRFGTFVTDPVNPLHDQPELARKVTIYHVAIDDDEQNSYS